MTDQGQITAADFDAELASIEAVQSELSESIDDFERRRQTEDRSKIAKWIVWLFIIACLGTLLFVAFAVFLDPVKPAGGGESAWQEGAAQMLTVLSSVILPVVTLVIGYYFGSETRQS